MTDLPDKLSKAHLERPEGSPYTAASIPSSMLKQFELMSRVETRAYSESLWAHRRNTAKLPPGEWRKRLISMAVQLSQSTVMSVEEAMDSILATMDRNNSMMAAISALVTLELRSMGKLPMMEPSKPRPRKFRGKQLPKWPYGGKW